MKTHGHVIPNPDGIKARCGGPQICKVCAQELVDVLQKGQKPPLQYMGIAIGTLMNLIEGKQPIKVGDKVRKTGKSRFEGTVIGEYTTLAGHHGWVVEVDPSASCSEVVHVYRDEYLEKRKELPSIHQLQSTVRKGCGLLGCTSTAECTGSCQTVQDGGHGFAQARKGGETMGF